MNILVITGNYPSTSRPTRGTFVYDLVQEFCRQGATVTTVAPEKIWWKSASHSDSYGSELSHVIRPNYVSFSDKTLYPGLSTGMLSLLAFSQAAKRAARPLSRPNVVYGHFLFPSGVTALQLGARFNVPAVVALGEDTMERAESIYGASAVHRHLQRFSRIITVSKGLKDYCVRRAGVSPDNVYVVPNAVDERIFYPRDRVETRKRLGLPREAFIVAFVGHFDERKGATRLLQALERHPEATAVFLGSGVERPHGKQVLFAGPVRHDEVPDWLAAADVFCLPTLSEGSCNAVNEALAVGVPVISSDIPAIREQVARGAAILVDPRSVDDIARALGQLLKNRKQREAMSRRALEIMKTRTLSARVTTILGILKNIVAGHGMARK